MVRAIQKALYICCCAAAVLLGYFILLRDLDSVDEVGEGLITVPEYRLLNTRYISVKEGERSLEFFSKVVTVDAVTRNLLTEAIKTLVYDDKGAATTVTADRGQYSLSDRKLNLWGNILSVSPEGFHWETENAGYLVETKYFFSPVKSHGYDKDHRLELWADQSKSSLPTNILKVSGNVVTHYNDPRRGLTKIQSDFGDIHKLEEKMYFRENVKFFQKDLEGQSKNAVLTYAKSVGGIKYFSAHDDVVLRQGSTRITRSQVAEFDGKKDTVFLTGFPSVQDGEDVMASDKITIYRTTGVVEATGTNAVMPKGASPAKTVQNKDEDLELIP